MKKEKKKPKKAGKTVKKTEKKKIKKAVGKKKTTVKTVGNPYEELKGWTDIPIGGIIEDAGNSKYYNTGDWRNFFPVRDIKKCTNCLTCWLYCPEGCIKVKDGKITMIDMTKCKGCGLCAEVCPVKCITMRKEKK